MATAKTIRQGVTLYSFSSEYRTFQYSFEDCMQLASQLGGGGVEIVGPMHRGAFPEATDEFERTFKSAVARYNLTPTSYGSYADSASYKSADDLFEFALLQLKSTFKLGIPIIRMNVGDDIDRLLPYAEKYKVRMAIEIHAPMAMGKDPNTVKVIENVVKKSSPYLGVMPDGGTFANKIPRVANRYASLVGVPDPLIKRCVEWYEAKVPLDKAVEEAKKDKDAATAVWAVRLMYNQAPAGDPEELRKIMPYVIHFHGKFWDLENGQEPCIPYEQVIRALVEGGFAGWLSAEYEGHLFNKLGMDSFDILKQYQAMVQNLAAKYSKAAPPA
jgi:sugar phosphate isomerase/epimerase